MACTNNGLVASGTTPPEGTSLAAATVPLAWVQLTTQQGAVYRWAKATIPHGAEKLGRVITFGVASRRLTDTSGGPQASTITTVLADTDRIVRTAAFAGTLQYAIVEYFVADLATLRANGAPQRIFRGRVQRWHADAQLTVTLTVQDDLTARLTSANAKDQQSPRRIIDDVHDATPLSSLFEKGCPEIYGELEDEPFIGTWELKHVQDITLAEAPSLGNLAAFLVCGGACADLPTLYSGNFSETPPVTRVEVPTSAYGDWFFAPGHPGWPLATKYYQINGRRWTLVFGNQGHEVVRLAREGRLPLVADVCSTEAVGDGTGLVITGPARAFLHWFNNRMVQDVGLNWAPIFPLGDYSLFNTASFERADSICAARGLVVAGVISAQNEFVSWRERVAEWCRNFGFDLGTNRHGQVMLAMLDRTQTYASAPLFTPAEMLAEGCSVDLDTDAIENIVPYVFKRNYLKALQDVQPPEGERGLREPYDGEWASGKHEVVDEASIAALGGHPTGERRADLQEYSLVRDATGAARVAAERLALHRRPNGRAVVSFALLVRDGWNLELGDIIQVQHFDLPWSSSRRCDVRQLDFDLDAMTIAVRVRDVHDLCAPLGVADPLMTGAWAGNSTQPITDDLGIPILVSGHPSLVTT